MSSKSTTQINIEEQLKACETLSEINAKKNLKACVITFGCAQNENDSLKIMGMLKKSGYDFTEDKKKADLIIINTCAVRENAHMRVVGNLGALKPLKRQNPSLIIGVCGCLAQKSEVAEEIHTKYPQVDMVFGTHSLHTLPSLILEVISNKKRVERIEDTDGYIIEDIPVLRQGGAIASVSIMYGCNNFCSYCVVPYVRGRERSRKKEDILKEIKNLAKDGYKEIMLLGQNVNSYGKDLDEIIDFSDLLKMVNDIDGIERVRFMTSHPKDFSDKLIDTMADCKKVCRQLHLPVQAGSNKVLLDMNRKYTKEEYLSKIQKVREKIPGIAITSDIIVGYPTETNEDFSQTIDLLKQVRYDMIFSFIYSKRQGTPASKLESVLTDEQIHKNFEQLVEVQNQISKQINDKYHGGTYKVLVEGVSKTDPNTYTGRTDTGKTVNFKGDVGMVGKMVDIKITEVKTWSLFGEVVK